MSGGTATSTVAPSRSPGTGAPSSETPSPTVAPAASSAASLAGVCWPLHAATTSGERSRQRTSSRSESSSPLMLSSMVP